MLPYMCAYLIVEGTSSFSLMVDYDGEKRGDLDCVSHGYRSPSVILSGGISLPSRITLRGNTTH